MHRPGKDEIVVHNMDIDRQEVHKKSSFLTQFPYEMPCQSLFSALIHYQNITSQINRTLHQCEALRLTGYQLVHLRNIKEKMEFKEASF